MTQVISNRPQQGFNLIKMLAAMHCPVESELAAQLLDVGDQFWREMFNLVVNRCGGRDGEFCRRALRRHQTQRQSGIFLTG